MSTGFEHWLKIENSYFFNHCRMLHFPHTISNVAFTRLGLLRKTSSAKISCLLIVIEVLIVIQVSYFAEIEDVANLFNTDRSTAVVDNTIA